MRIHQLHRRGGKTVWLVNQVKRDPNGILVCMNAQEADRLVKDYPDVPVGKFITLAEALSTGLHGLRPEPVLYIDNADLILTQIFKHRIAEISVTAED